MIYPVCERAGPLTDTETKASGLHTIDSDIIRGSSIESGTDEVSIYTESFNSCGVSGSTGLD